MSCSCGRAGTSPGMDLCACCEEDYWMDAFSRDDDASERETKPAEDPELPF